jgi:hypothetical protein
VEWGIVGLKWKCKRFMKHFDSTMDKYNHLFEVAISILINLLHKCHVNSTYEVIGNQVDDLIDYDWDANF